MDLLLDTSMLRRVKAIEDLAAMAGRGGHRLLVPGLVYAERDFQCRRHLSAQSPPQTYDPSAVEYFFARFEGVLGILPLDAEEARGVAERLHRRFPTDRDWLAARRRASRACVNLETDRGDGDGSRCAAPVDLYLAALASPARPIVTMEATRRWEWTEGRAEGSVLDLDGAKRRLAGP